MTTCPTPGRSAAIVLVLVLTSHMWGTGNSLLARLSSSTTIAIDPGKTWQTISGWEVVAFALEPSDPAFPNFRDALIDLAVNDLGINRIRLEIRSGVENSGDNWSAHQTGIIDYPTWRSRRYATANDNADPCSIDWSGFHFSEMDNTIDRIVIPLRAALAAKGERLIVNVNYVAFTGQITRGVYIHSDPAEYAEFVLATYLHLHEKYGWTPDLWEVLLEPDNVPQWSGRLLGEAIVAATERLRAAGFEPAFVAPSNTNMGNAVRDFDQMIQVAGVLPVLREFAYHRYGGVSLQNLQAIAARARQHGLSTAMLEWWSNSNGYPTLHEDLKIGNNSAWEQGVLAGDLSAETALCVVDRADPAHPKVMLGGKTKFLRQYYKFVRPGAIRIEVASQLTSFDPLAFINADGGCVVVVKCNAGGQFSIGPLAVGTYGIKYTTANEFDIDLPDQTVDPGQPVVAEIPQAGVLTVYAKPVTFDQEAPTAPTDLVASEVSLSRITVAWTASTDNIAVAGYRIYRDGTQIGFSSSASFEDTRVEAGTSYVYEVLAYDTAGNRSLLSQALTAVVPSPGIGTDVLGYWKFDEGRGGAAVDSSEYRHHGTIFGAAWAQGRRGGALSFREVTAFSVVAASP